VGVERVQPAPMVEEPCARGPAMVRVWGIHGAVESGIRVVTGSDIHGRAAPNSDAVCLYYYHGNEASKCDIHTCRNMSHPDQWFAQRALAPYDASHSDADPTKANRSQMLIQGGLSDSLPVAKMINSYEFRGLIICTD
jgi:hypothetical protein